MSQFADKNDIEKERDRFGMIGWGDYFGERLKNYLFQVLFLGFYYCLRSTYSQAYKAFVPQKGRGGECFAESSLQYLVQDLLLGLILIFFILIKSIWKLLIFWELLSFISRKFSHFIFLSREIPVFFFVGAVAGQFERLSLGKKLEKTNRKTKNSLLSS